MNLDSISQLPLASKRLYFELFSESAIEEVLSMYNEEDTFKYIKPLQNRSREEYIQFLETVVGGRNGEYLVKNITNNLIEYLGIIAIVKKKYGMIKIKKLQSQNRLVAIQKMPL